MSGSGTWSPELDAFYRAAALPPLLQDPPQAPDERALASLAPLLWFDGRIHESMVCIRQLEQRQQVDSNTLLLRGFWELYLGESEGAMDTFTTVLGSDPTSAWGRYGRAYALLYLRNYAGAAADFERLVAELSGLPGAEVMAPAARALAEGRRPGEVRMAPLPDLPAGVSETLQMRVLQGPYAAVAHGSGILRRLPADTRFPLSRLLVELFVEAGLDDQAMEMLSQAQADRPADGLLAYYRGILLRRAGRADESHESFREAYESAPLESRVWAGYGAGLLEREHLSESARAYRTAVFLEEHDANAWGDLGQVRAQLRDYVGAIDAFSRAIDLGARTFANYVNRGWCAAELGQRNQATLDWAVAIELDPINPKVQALRQAIANTASVSPDDRFVFGDLD